MKLTVKSNIDGVQESTIESSHFEWAAKHLEKANAVLGWESIHVALAALRGEDTSMYDTYATLFWKFLPYNSDSGAGTKGKIIPVLRGGSQYGSEILVEHNNFYFRSCGGHWFTGEWHMHATCTWNADSLVSTTSWGGIAQTKAERIALLEAGTPLTQPSETP